MWDFCFFWMCFCKFKVVGIKGSFCIYVLGVFLMVFLAAESLFSFGGENLILINNCLFEAFD